jgi:hypothetical protein
LRAEAPSTIALDSTRRGFFYPTLTLVIVVGFRSSKGTEQKAMKKLRMSLSLSSLILVGVAAPATSQAQIAVNMSLLKCGQYLAMSPDQSRIYAAWMSGWFNQKIGSTNVNMEAYARNVENVKAWCGTNPEELVMTGLQRATGK